MHVARKRFGQHFLVDPAVIDAHRRARSTRGPGEALVEIGPGCGALTDAAARALRRADRDRARPRPGRAAAPRRPGSTVVEADVLTVDFAALAARRGRPQLRVVGNLPYNISTPILFHLLAAGRRASPTSTSCCRRRSSTGWPRRPGSKDYGRLTRDAAVALRHRARCSTCRREAFEPPPRVDSAVVRMTPLPAPAASTRRCSASSSRSRSRSAASCCATRSAAGSTSAARQPPFDLQRRAEEVPVDEYLALAAALRKRPEESARSGGSAAGRSVLIAGSGALHAAFEPHRRVEGAAHQRHVRAEAAVRRRSWRRLDRLVAALTFCVGATSVARSHDPDSWERATERIEAPERYFALRPEVGRVAEDVEQLLARLAVEARVVGQAARARRRSRAAGPPCAPGRSCSRTARRGSCRSAPGTVNASAMPSSTSCLDCAAVRLA